MTIFLTVLAIALTALLIRQHRRNSQRVARLSNALKTHDRRLLGSGPFHSAPSEFQNLERQIFEQLFEAEGLEAKIGRREDLLGAVVEGLSDAVLVFDESLNVRFSNPSAARLFEWETSPTGKPASSCIRDFELLDLIERTVTHGQHQNTELRLRHNNPGVAQGERILEVDVAPLLRSDTESVSRARVVLHDITEARQLEQVRKDFVANASHELRTPLTIINGYLENLIDGGIDDSEVSARFLSVMKKHGDRIARIIEDMLTISKLESETDVLHSKPFDLQRCAEEVIARLQPIIESKQASVRLEFPDDSTLAGDAFYWDQILFNLVENALKENEAPDLEIEISLERDDNIDTIRVADNGVGIPKAAQAFIFKRFYRVDQNRNAEKKGTGLGLSIVKRAIEAHGGTISVESSPGISTVFVIKTPRPTGNSLAPSDPTENAEDD